MPETFRVLQTLATQTSQVEASAVIIPDEFRSTYLVAHEQTSSSPSSRHIGHYKAVLADPLLVQLHAQIMSLPFQAGFAPDRWTKVTDIMLEKEANVSIHALERSWELYKAPRTSGAFEGTLQGA
jgi:hypothetical protein